ncbi:Hypothetical protein FKW44_007035 [Caligus rogercresseyi]|uniref:Uncharacterized protein n=1 Tax=Caligus rogercresseyi TaxID=217165 RepID=A0A7T8QTA7_CALRO|nr:Hypothetical protein FKW44_007035 [Caligus rogercresseyi]
MGIGVSKPSAKGLSGPAKHSNGAMGFLTLGQRLSGPAKHSDGVLGFLTLGKGLSGPAKHSDEYWGSNPRP